MKRLARTNCGPPIWIGPLPKVAPETLQTILDYCEDEVEKLKLIFAANTGKRVGEQVAILI